MMIKLTAVLVIAALSLLLGVANAQETPEPLTELTIEKIMRDPLWIGRVPSDVHWSYDSKLIYFNWNQARVKDGDSLYSVSYNGGTPKIVPLDEQKQKPGTDGDYNLARTKMVYDKRGDIFILNIKSGKSQQLTKTNEQKTDPRFTRDEQAIVYSKDDNLFKLALESGVLIQLTDFRSGEKPQEDDSAKDQKDKKDKHDQWLADEQLNLIAQLAEKKLTREEKKKKKKEKIEREKNDPDGRPLEIYLGQDRVRSARLSPDEQFVTYTLRRSGDKRTGTIIPNYVTESGYTDSFEARAKVGASQNRYLCGIYDLAGDTSYFATLDSLPGIFDQPAYLAEYKTTDSTATDSTDSDTLTKPDEPAIRNIWFAGMQWSDDGSRLLCDIRALDNKDRWLALLDLSTGTFRAIDRQHDDAWVGGPALGGWYSGQSWGWLRDNRTVWFLSEQSGYSHLYTIDIEDGTRRQLTDGNYEVSSIEISHDKKQFYFISSEARPGLRNFYRLKLSSGEPEQIIDLGGYCQVTISPDEKQLAIKHSLVNQPWELYVQKNQPGAKATRVTHSQTEEFLSYPWRDPKVITFIAEDSALVYAHLFEPDNPTLGAPAVIFVHGAGYTQNVRKMWSHYYREYMFHNLLVDRGYYVLDIDYRGSAGYGRDWRTGIYRHMGGKDLSDQVDGAKYLIARHGVDPKKIGIYGGSYGGFITLMAMFNAPETFTAGAALRSVTDWAHYDHGYTANILNVPLLDSLAYVRSSPIYFAEGLKGHLLICHGMLDDNVHFQDVVRLSQRLIELGKDNWEMALYPLERHSFTEPASWTDEYRRILKLFETNLNSD